MLKALNVAKWVVFADLAAGVAINAAWAAGLINPLGWGVNLAVALKAGLL